jgi:hypothetical protein
LHSVTLQTAQLARPLLAVLGSLMFPRWTVRRSRPRQSLPRCRLPGHGSLVRPRHCQRTTSILPHHRPTNRPEPRSNPASTSSAPPSTPQAYRNDRPAVSQLRSNAGRHQQRAAAAATLCLPQFPLRATQACTTLAATGLLAAAVEAAVAAAAEAATSTRGSKNPVWTRLQTRGSSKMPCAY